MSLIVKNYLYQISNGLVAVFSAISRVYGSYSDFIHDTGVSFQAGRNGILNIVNGSCLKIEFEYNKMREQVMFTLPEKATALFVTMWVTLVCSFLIALLNLFYKASTGDRSFEYSETDTSVFSGPFPMPPSSSSSATTFADGDAMNGPPPMTTEDESSTFCAVQASAPFCPLTEIPPLTDFEIPSLGLGHTGFSSLPSEGNESCCSGTI
jgi:hypothetical protein